MGDIVKSTKSQNFHNTNLEAEEKIRRIQKHTNIPQFLKADINKPPYCLSLNRNGIYRHKIFFYLVAVLLNNKRIQYCPAVIIL